MIRILLWFVIIFIVLKIIRIISTWQRRPRENEIDLDLTPKGPTRFDSIQDAEFEDLTPKPPAPPPAG